MEEAIVAIASKGRRSTFIIVMYMVICWIRVTSAITCSQTVRKGPFAFKPDPMQISVPTRRNATLERVRVVQDVKLTMMQRSYWTSYCYNGGPLDPNTGCMNGITTNNPTREEAKMWISKGQCAVGPDCVDCWGSDAQACIQAEKATKHWVAGKELTDNSNNNHFPFHSCNLSWRCGIHTAAFPTFVTKGGLGWIIYTEHSNGTQITLTNRDSWDLGDMLVVKTQEPVIIKEKLNASCFTNSQKELACYDDEYSKFIEFKQNWVCQGQFCYLNPEIKAHETHEAQEIANLHAASIEDLKTIVAKEHQLNEELRYNFALVASELEQLRALVREVIISTAKIDDRLLGTILGNPARSQFLSETAFLLSPCSEPPITESNCFKDQIYKDGRWIKNTKPSECLNVEKIERLDLVKRKELWFPELGEEHYLGTAREFDGWTYYAHEKENLNKVVEWVQNHQATTSLADLVEYPKNFLNHALTGFLTTHAITIAIMMGVIYVLCRTRKGDEERRTQIIVTTTEDQRNFQSEHIQHQYREGSHIPEYEVVIPAPAAAGGPWPLEPVIITVSEDDMGSSTAPPTPPHRGREKFKRMSFRRSTRNTRGGDLRVKHRLTARGTSNRKIRKPPSLRGGYINHV